MVLVCRPRCAAMENLRSHFGHLKEPGVILDSPLLDSRQCETPNGVNFPVGCTADGCQHLPQGVSPPPPQHSTNYADQFRSARGLLWKNNKRGMQCTFRISGSARIFAHPYDSNDKRTPNIRIPSQAICRTGRVIGSFSSAACWVLWENALDIVYSFVATDRLSRRRWTNFNWVTVDG